MTRWAQFAEERTGLESVTPEMLYQHGLGLGFLATVRADSGPGVHPIQYA